MSKQLRKEGVRLHVVFYAEDVARLDALVSVRQRGITRSDLIRDIIHTYLDRLDAKTNERAKNVAAANITDSDLPSAD